MPTKRHPRNPCEQLGGKVTLHERLIRDIVEADPRMMRRGFWRDVRALIEELGLDADELCAREFLPDAYLIDPTRQEINMVEVEVSCPLSDKKKQDYAWMWFCWESEDTDWMPRLFVVDRYGNSNEMDLKAMYFSEIATAARLTPTSRSEHHGSN
jgi:hypothetical protein